MILRPGGPDAVCGALVIALSVAPMNDFAVGDEARGASEVRGLRPPMSVSLKLAVKH